MTGRLSFNLRSPYDLPRNHRSVRNAIRVDNIGGSQVGHIPRDVAAKLAGLLDRGAVTVEGVIKDGNRKFPFRMLQVQIPQCVVAVSGSRQFSLSMYVVLLRWLLFSFDVLLEHSRYMVPQPTEGNWNPS
jgi:hypothetical protein